MPEPLTLSAVEVGCAEAPLAGHGQHLRRERLVELDEVHVGQRQPGAVERLRGRRHRADAHRARRARRRRPSDAAGPAGAARVRRPSPAVVTMQAAAPSFWPLALPAVTVASGSTAQPHRHAAGQRLQRRVGPRVLVGVDQTRAAACGRTVDRHDLVVEAAGVAGRRRPAGASAARTRPAPARLIPYLRRRFSAVSSMPPGTGELPPPAVTRPGRAGRAAWRPSPRTPQRIAGGVELDLTHALRAAGDDHVAGAGLHLHGRVDDGLQSGAAAAVELQARRPRPAARRRAPRCGRSPGASPLG